MRRSVYLAATARQDIERLHDWLFDKNPNAALRLIAVFDQAFERLSELPDRGRLVGEQMRELVVPFGGSTYVVRYGVDPDGVFITRIWHSLEHR